jgi:hypothetical protein
VDLLGTHEQGNEAGRALLLQDIFAVLHAEVEEY